MQGDDRSERNKATHFDSLCEWLRFVSSSIVSPARDGSESQSFHVIRETRGPSLSPSFPSFRVRIHCATPLTLHRKPSNVRVVFEPWKARGVKRRVMSSLRTLFISRALYWWIVTLRKGHFMRMYRSIPISTRRDNPPRHFW